MGERTKEWEYPWFVGYSFLWAARLACVFGYPLFDIMVSGPSANNYLNMPMQVAYVIATLAVGVVALKRAAALERRVLPITFFAGFCFLCGSVVLLISTVFLAGNLSSYLAASGLFVGVGDALLSILWGRYFVSGPIERAKTEMPVSIALGVILYFVLLLLPKVASLSLLIILSCASAVLLKRGIASRQAMPLENNYSLRKAVDKLCIPLLCVVVCGFVFGLIGQIALTAPAEQGMEHIIPPSGIALAGFIACAITFIVREKVAFDAVYKVVFAVALSGLFLLPFLNENYAVFFNIFVVCAYYLMETYYFYYAVEIVQVYKASPYVVYGFSHAIFCVSILAGIVLSVAVFSHSGYGLIQLTLISFISAYLCGMGLLLLVRRQQASRSTKQKEESAVCRSTEEVIRRLSRMHGFTARETEVFSLLISGRSGAYIADELGISVNTVKGYVQGVYRKCDVHNRQELIDLFETHKKSEA